MDKTCSMEDCRYCSCATMKRDPYSKKNHMYCQTADSVIMLRRRWGARKVPGWCPKNCKEELNEK